MSKNELPLSGKDPARPMAPAAIETVSKLWHFAVRCRFPLEEVPKRSYKDSSSGFGTKRPNIGPGILHPGCDLEAPVGTPVLAVDDGLIIAGPYDFYLGTDAIDVQHGLFIVRYGEIKKGFRPKSRTVKKGDVLGEVGKVGRGNMLHFEMFAGTATGPLTIKNKPPWNRRSDLIDPTPFLDLWALKL
jgi:murein DD-endopeptidase MepM/ murein hydrolase activator NlpD